MVGGNGVCTVALQFRFSHISSYLFFLFREEEKKRSGGDGGGGGWGDGDLWGGYNAWFGRGSGRMSEQGRFGVGWSCMI